MLFKASVNVVLAVNALLLAHIQAESSNGGMNNRLIEIGAGGLLAYIIIKLVLDYLRSKDAVRDRRTDDYEPNNGIAFSRELVAVLADIKLGLSDGRREAHEQHEQQIRLLTEMVTRLRMRD
jgi:hypothetical protein